jgi:hypothetical protein
MTDDEAIWGARADEELYDLTRDAGEQHNVGLQPDFAEVRDDLKRRLQDWMQQTDDPLLKGRIPRNPPPGITT